MSHQHPGSRIRARQYQQCEIVSCTKFVHGLSRYCSAHERHDQRFGSPTQGRVSRYGINGTKPYERTVRQIMLCNPDHPALKLVIDELDAMLVKASHNADVASIAGPGRPGLARQDHVGKMYRELARVHAAGVRGRDVLLTVAGCYFFARANEKLLEPASRPYNFAIAKLVLHLARREHFDGWRESKHGSSWVKYKGLVYIGVHTLENLGRHLAVTTAALMVALEPAYDAQVMAPTSRKVSLASALVVPFVNTHQRKDSRTRQVSRHAAETPNPNHHRRKHSALRTLRLHT